MGLDRRMMAELGLMVQRLTEKIIQGLGATLLENLDPQGIVCNLTIPLVQKIALDRRIVGANSYPAHQSQISFQLQEGFDTGRE